MTKQCIGFMNDSSGVMKLSQGSFVAINSYYKDFN